MSPKNPIKTKNPWTTLTLALTPRTQAPRIQVATQRMAAMHDHGLWCPKIAELINWMANEHLCPSTCAGRTPTLHPTPLPYTPTLHPYPTPHTPTLHPTPLLYTPTLHPHSPTPTPPTPPRSPCDLQTCNPCNPIAHPQPRSTARPAALRVTTQPAQLYATPRRATPGTGRSSSTNATPAGCGPPRPRQRPRPRRLPSPRSSAAVRRASRSTEHLCAAAVYLHERARRHCTFPPRTAGAALGLPPGGSLPTPWPLPRTIASAYTTHSAVLVPHPFVRAVPSHG